MNPLIRNCTACAVRVTIFSTGVKFRPVSIYTLLCSSRPFLCALDDCIHLPKLQHCTITQLISRALSSPSYVVKTIFRDSSMLAFTQTGYNAMFGHQFAKPYHHQHGICAEVIPVSVTFVFMETHQRSMT